MSPRVTNRPSPARRPVPRRATRAPSLPRATAEYPVDRDSRAGSFLHVAAWEIVRIDGATPRWWDGCQSPREVASAPFHFDGRARPEIVADRTVTRRYRGSSASRARTPRRLAPG